VTRWRDALAVKVHCPVTPETLAALLAGKPDALEADPAAGAILAIMRGANPLGDFGPYQEVVEIAQGWEGFRPTEAARPALGEAGKTALSPTVILTTYAPANADVDGALAELLGAHPWEVPVIECYPTRLLVRD
jgi:hypothetical protein